MQPPHAVASLSPSLKAAAHTPLCDVQPPPRQASNADTSTSPVNVNDGKEEEEGEDEGKDSSGTDNGDDSDIGSHSVEALLERGKQLSDTVTKLLDSEMPALKQRNQTMLQGVWRAGVSVAVGDWLCACDCVAV